MAELTRELDVGEEALWNVEEKIEWLEARFPGGDEKALTETMVKVERLKGM